MINCVISIECYAMSFNHYGSQSRNASIYGIVGKYSGELTRKGTLLKNNMHHIDESRGF